MQCNIPDIIELSSFGGNYKKYEDAVYSAFLQCTQDKTFTFQGQEIGYKRHPEFKDKPATFWHIISEGKDEPNRMPNLRRYERIKWPFHLITHCANACPELLIWENTRKSHTNVLIFCPRLDYLVVLTKRNGYLLLWTAYPITYKNQRNKLMKEYREYNAKAAQP